MAKNKNQLAAEIFEILAVIADDEAVKNNPDLSTLVNLLGHKIKEAEDGR